MMLVERVPDHAAAAELLRRVADEIVRSAAELTGESRRRQLAQARVLRADADWRESCTGPVDAPRGRRPPSGGVYGSEACRAGQ